MRLLALGVLIAPAVAFADAPLALTAKTAGSNLELTFKNTSTAPVKMTTHVRAGLDHHDWLTVELTGKQKRTLQFRELRTKAIPVEATLAPGGTASRSIDLALWAINGENVGGPLEPGDYTVALTWDTTQEARGPRQKLTGSTRLTIAAPKEAGCKEPAPGTAKLELLAQQVGPAAKFQIGLHNPDTTSHCVYGIIRTYETQNDWLSVSFTTPGAKPTVIGFAGARDKSYSVAYELPPGATIWTTWDLADWHKRVRGAKALPPKTTLWLEATWNASREREVWRGTAKTGFGLKLP